MVDARVARRSGYEDEGSHSMGLRVDIHRGTYRSRFNTFDAYVEITVVNVPGPFEPSRTAPAARLIPGHFPGQVIVVPDEYPEGMVGPMFGGTFAYTSDSRWFEATKMYGAVPIHDLFDTSERYDALSR